MSETLLKQHSQYGKCITKIKETEQAENFSMSDLAIDLFDLAPSNVGDPKSTYFIICLGGPLAWAISAGLVVIVIVAKDDSGRDDPPDPDPDPEDDDGGICVPGDGLDGLNVMCG